MPSLTLLESTGIPKVKPARFGSIYTRRFFAGYVSNRSPFEEGRSRVDQRFYGGASDTLWVGSENIELTANGLLQRRPGYTLYSSATPLASPPRTFYAHKDLSSAITLLTATDTTVYTVTPTTILAVYTKLAGAGKSQFLTVGDFCYICDGKQNVVYSTSGVADDGIIAPPTAPTLSFRDSGALWSATKAFTVGQIIIDTNGQPERCTTAGTSGTTQPAWPTGVGTTTTDGGVTWTLLASGGTVWQSGEVVAVGYQITDPHQNLQQVTTGGTTGTNEPAWALGATQTTADGSTVVWKNMGKDPNAGVFETVGAYYVYAYQNTTTGDWSTSSPQSGFTGPQGNQNITVGGDYSADPQVSKVGIFRTLDGGATFLLVATIANVVGTGTWSWVDQLPDSALNILIEAPINHQNDPAPAAACQAFHAGRRWVANGNFVNFSSGPDQGTVAGNGNNCFPPANVFVYPTPVLRLVPMQNGLLVFCADSIYVIQGTTIASFFTSLFAGDIGILSPYALDTDAGTIVCFTADSRLLAIDGSGVTDIGAKIADKLVGIDPTMASVAIHTYGSNDHAVYLSDGQSVIWRANPNQAPEGGVAWSAPALPAPGAGAIASCETSLGVRKLLMAPPTGTSYPILYRDVTSYADHGTLYTATAVVGSLVLSAPGTDLTEISSIVVETSFSPAVKVSVLLNEIAGSFDTLIEAVPDPPEYAVASTTIQALRFYLAANQTPIACRHLQLAIGFPAANSGDIIYSFALVAGQAL